MGTCPMDLSLGTEAMSDMLWAGGVGFSSALVLQLTGIELGFE